MFPFEGLRTVRMNQSMVVVKASASALLLSLQRDEYMRRCCKFKTRHIHKFLRISFFRRAGPFHAIKFPRLSLSDWFSIISPHDCTTNHSRPSKYWSAIINACSNVGGSRISRLKNSKVGRKFIFESFFDSGFEITTTSKPAHKQYCGELGLWILVS